MRENKNVMTSLMAMMLSAILIAGGLEYIWPSNQAYAEDLSVGETVSEIIDNDDDEEVVEPTEPTEEELLKFAQEELTNKLTDFKSTWSNYLTVKKNNKINKWIDKVPTLVSLEECDKLSSTIDATLVDYQSFAETVKNNREKAYNQAKKKYDKYKQYLKKDYKKKANTYFKKIQTGFNEEKISSYKNKINTISEKGKKVKQWRAKATKKAQKTYKPYKKYLTAKQQKAVAAKMAKIDKSYDKTKIDNIVKYVKKVSNKGKTIKTSRAKAIKEVKTYYKTYQSLLSNSDKESITKYKSKINKSFTVKDITHYKNKAIALIQEKYAIPGIDTRGWSIDKINYVKEWGRKNNSFLAGSPMAGVGYYIARAAYDTNIDPAALAAISRIESNCGRACCGAYNAYGWIWPYAKSFSSWEDGINQWHSYFSQWFSGDIPLSSMHGYGGYGVGSISGYLWQIRNA